MKRSEINRIIKRFEKLLSEYRVVLPPFMHWTPEEWYTKGREYDEIRDNMLGWDVTDYGMNQYDKLGLALITLRNGNVHNEKYPKSYAEKLLMIEEGQVSPRHFHWHKMEDIINKGGGNLVFKLYNAGENGEKLETDVIINQDGREYKVRAGKEIVLKPGDSLTLYPYYYHEFIVEPGTGTTLVGEVSKCNDDNADIRFYEELGRFPVIEEDEAPYRLLCNEYPSAE